MSQPESVSFERSVANIIISIPANIEVFIVQKYVFYLLAAVCVCVCVGFELNSKI